MQTTTLPVTSPPVDLERKTYSIGEFAEMMGISYRHAINLAVADELPGVFRLGRRWLISKEAVDQLLREASHAVKGNAE